MAQKKQKHVKSTNRKSGKREQLNSDRIPEGVGYFDISKVTIRFVVIASLVCILLILVLSVLFPTSETTPQETTTEIGTTETIPANTDPKTGFTTVEDKTYYYLEDETAYTGWIKINDETYYFDPDGVMVTDWYILNGHQYYFDENGVMLTSQWKDDKYLSEEGYILKNTVTPDGGYVDLNGIRNEEVSLKTSQEGLTDLKVLLQNMVDSYSGTWSVYVKNVDSNQYLIINDVQQYSASLIKLYCAATVYDLIDKGTLEESETVTRLMSEMVSISDNDAFNLLVMKCAPDNSHVTGRGIIQEYIDTNGYTSTTITSILVPTKYKAPPSPGRNYTGVVDCGLLLERIYKGQCVSPEASEQFLELLLKQTHISKIPAGLPEGTKCANKTGDTNAVQHDTAIVYSPNCVYILCVMSSDCKAAIPNIQSISRTVYDYFNPEVEMIIVEPAEE